MYVTAYSQSRLFMNPPVCRQQNPVIAVTVTNANVLEELCVRFYNLFMQYGFGTLGLYVASLATVLKFSVSAIAVALPHVMNMQQLPKRSPSRACAPCFKICVQRLMFCGM